MPRHGEESEEKTEPQNTGRICMVSPCRKKNIGRCKWGQSLEKKKKIKSCRKGPRASAHTSSWPSGGNQETIRVPHARRSVEKS
jgi:hypothetical protein